MSAEKRQMWQQKMAESRAALTEILDKLAPEQWSTPVFSEGAVWTVKTVVSHLLDSERGMSIQVHKIRKGEETVPEGFDLTRWNAGVEKRVGDLTPAQFMEALAQTRARTLQGMDSLSDDEWALTGRHPSRGMITVEQYYETMHGHEMIHGEDIRKAVAA
ncbi:MAG: DinB family protein [Caldilineaceae bacterium]|nr:DinB family protein [Caldilineaceae bacterium]MCB0140466.1 DinB family protein [Caldilineaceae bacterium]